MTTGDVVYSLRFSLIKILPEPGFDLGSTAGEHLDKHNILADAQHGFRKRRSCETQLLLTCHDLASVVNNSGQVDMLVLDFAKAFDTVAHRRLLSKVAGYGIRGSLHRWITSFLEGRTQKVVVEVASSDPSPVKSGVLQGSVLVLVH